MLRRINIFLVMIPLVFSFFSERAASEHAKQQILKFSPDEIGASNGQLHFISGLAIPLGESKGEMMFLQLERMFDHRFSIRTSVYSEWSSNEAGFSQSGFGFGLAWHLLPQHKFDYVFLIDTGIAFADLFSRKPDAALETAMGFAFDYHLDPYHFLQLQYRVTDSSLNGINLSARRRRPLMVVSWGFLF